MKLKINGILGSNSVTMKLSITADNNNLLKSTHVKRVIVFCRLRTISTVS